MGQSLQALLISGGVIGFGGSLIGFLITNFLPERLQTLERYDAIGRC